MAAQHNWFRHLNRSVTCAFALFALTASIGFAPAQAQECAAETPNVNQAFFSSTDTGGKFRLIARACPSLAARASGPVRLSPNTPYQTSRAEMGAAQPSERPARELSELTARSVTIELSDVAAPTGRSAASTASNDARPVANWRAAGISNAKRQPGRPSRYQQRRMARVFSLHGAMTDIARENGLDPLLLHAIAHVESRHDPRAVSHAGARGLMQVMPATGQRFGANDNSALDYPTTNLRASAAYLRTLMLRYHDDLKLVLAAYNAGEGAVDRAGGNIPPYRETQDYVRKVLAVYNRLADEFKVDRDGRLRLVSASGGLN